METKRPHKAVLKITDSDDDDDDDDGDDQRVKGMQFT